MDYVVAGFGIGAILALIGFALWELFGNVEVPGRSWVSRAAIGLMLGALVIWAVTGVSLISHIEDSTGSQLVLSTTLVTLIAVAGGAFWYWRADRSMAAASPRPARVSAQQEIDVVAAEPAEPADAGDVELTEWDSWPERDAGKAPASEREPADPAPAASFEPEVAAAAPEADEVESDIPEAVDAEANLVEEAEPFADDEEPQQPIEAATDTVEIEADLPANVRPFRAPFKPEAELPKQVVAEDVLIAETVDVARVNVRDEEEPPAIAVEEVEIVAVVEEEKPAVVDEPDTELVDKEDQPTLEPEEDQQEAPVVANDSDPSRAGFESSLLADIDGSLVEDDGGYRSPLLSDLGSDKLEGVGLAKWRPDARLTVEDEEELPPSEKRGRRA